MVEEQGVSIELVETKLTDEELSSLEQKQFDKSKPTDLQLDVPRASEIKHTKVY